MEYEQFRNEIYGVFREFIPDYSDRHVPTEAAILTLYRQLTSEGATDVVMRQNAVSFSFGYTAGLFRGTSHNDDDFLPRLFERLSK